MLDNSGERERGWRQRTIVQADLAMLGNHPPSSSTGQEFIIVGEIVLPALIFSAFSPPDRSGEAGQARQGDWRCSCVWLCTKQAPSVSR